MFLSLVANAKDERSSGKQNGSAQWIDKTPVVLSPGQPKIVSLSLKLDAESLNYKLGVSDGLTLRPLSLPSYEKSKPFKVDIELLTQTAGRYYIHLYLDTMENGVPISSVMSRIVIAESGEEIQLQNHKQEKDKPKQELRLLPINETRILTNE